jgi:hypothetical protein
VQGHDTADHVDDVVSPLGGHEPVAEGQPGPPLTGVDAAGSALAVHSKILA